MDGFTSQSMQGFSVKVQIMKIIKSRVIYESYVCPYNETPAAWSTKR